MPGVIVPTIRFLPVTVCSRLVARPVHNAPMPGPHLHPPLCWLQVPKVECRLRTRRSRLSTCPWVSVCHQRGAFSSFA